MGRVVFLSCLLFGMACPALGLAGHSMEMGLSIETEISGRFSPFDITWSQEVSGGPMS